MPKENLKDKVEGNELDLSLSNLTSVPVKDLAAIPKATHLDLSCNLLSELPDNFSTLTHLVKIDLSKNLLSSLPEDFGDLRNLQHLDLLGNKLSMLPLSFFQLRKLKWLDLKDNPLEAELKTVAGDCLDEKQCKKCAADVVEYMRIMNNRLEKMRQREEEERRREEMARLEEIEREKQQRKEEKRKEKEMRRREFELSRTPISSYEEETENGDRDTISDEDDIPAVTPKFKKGSKCSCSCLLSWTTVTVVVFFLLVAGLMLHCGRNPSANECEAIRYKSHLVPLRHTYYDPFVALIGEHCREAWSFTTDKLEYVSKTIAEYYYSAVNSVNKKWREFNGESPQEEADTQGQRSDKQEAADGKKDVEKEGSSAKTEEKTESTTKKEEKKGSSAKKDGGKESTSKKEEKKEGTSKTEEKKKDSTKT